MKLIKPIKQEKCPTCNRNVTHTQNAVRCSNVLLNGCEGVFCIITCWPQHADIHREEWDNLSEVQREAYETRYSQAHESGEPVF